MRKFPYTGTCKYDLTVRIVVIFVKGIFSTSQSNSGLGFVKSFTEQSATVAG